MVAPGPLTPTAYFQRVAHSGDYILPHYVSAFIVASNIQLFYPGLGSWNYSMYDDQTNDAVDILLKYAYAPVLNGGVGPFSFETPAGNEHNYQIRRANGGLLITLRGGQVIGYILKTVSKFPNNQTEPSMNVTQCDEDPDTNPTEKSRAKRSIPDNPKGESAFDLRKLAVSLFSEGLPPAMPSDHIDLIRDKEVISSKYINQLIKNGDMKQEQLAEFIQSLGNKPDPAGTVNTTMEEYNYE